MTPMRDVETKLSRIEIRRLQQIDRGPKLYMAGGVINPDLQRRGLIKISKDWGLWIEYSITRAGRAALIAQADGGQHV